MKKLTIICLLTLMAAACSDKALENPHKVVSQESVGVGDTSFVYRITTVKNTCYQNEHIHYDAFIRATKLWSLYYTNPKKADVIKDERRLFFTEGPQPSYQEWHKVIKEGGQHERFDRKIKRDVYGKENPVKQVASLRLPSVWEVFEQNSQGLDSLIYMPVVFDFVKISNGSDSAWILHDLEYKFIHSNRAISDLAINIHYDFMGKNTPVSQVLVWASMKPEQNSKDSTEFLLKLEYWEEQGKMRSRGHGFQQHPSGNRIDPAQMQYVFGTKNNIVMREGGMLKPSWEAPVK